MSAKADQRFRRPQRILRRAAPHPAWAVILCLAFAFSAPAEATDSSSITTDASTRILDFLEITPPGHIQPLRFGMLLTADAYLGPDRATDNDAGFDLSDARLSFGGELEKGFGYFVQANLVDSRPVLDMIIKWKAEPYGFQISAGYFRTRFAGEFVIPAPRLDFVERSQIVRALSPGRQVGIQIDQEIVGEALVAHAGVFNGNGLDTNDDERFLYVLRFDGRIQCGEFDSVFEYGINGAYSEDDDTDLGFDFPKSFAGKRWLAGADARWTMGSVFVSAEGLYGSIDPNGRSYHDVYGYQASVGWTLNRLIQLLVRYDAFYAASLQEDRDLAIGSIVFNFTEIISLQGELRVPTRGEQPSPGGVASLNVTF
jgi:hypothetical protein